MATEAELAHFSGHKAKPKADVTDDVEAFLARGGTITQVEDGATGWEERSWRDRPMRVSKNAKF